MQIPTPNFESKHIPPKPSDCLNSPNMEMIDELVTPTICPIPFPISPPSFKAKLLEQRDHINIDTDLSSPIPPPIVAQDQEMYIPSSEEGDNTPITIPILPEDRQRINKPL